MVDSKEVSIFLLTFFASFVFIFQFGGSPERSFSPHRTPIQLGPIKYEKVEKIGESLETTWLLAQRNSRLQLLLNPFTPFQKPPSQPNPGEKKQQQQQEEEEKQEENVKVEWEEEIELTRPTTIKSLSEVYRSSALETQRAATFQRAVEQYKEKHKELVESGKNLAICKIGHGFGNLFQSMSSCLLFGVLSGRAILFGPQDFYRSSGSWKNFFAEFPAYFAEGTSRFLATSAQLEKAEAEPAKFLRAEAIRGDCKAPRDVIAKYSEDQIIDLEGPEGWDFWMDLLTQNPHTSWSQSFPQNTYSILFNTLLPPHSEIADEIQRFKSEYFGKYTIGIQVRTHMSVDVLKHGIIPFEFYLQVAEQLTHEAPVDPNDVVWFIACVDVERIKKAQRDYGHHRKIVFYNGEMSRTPSGNRIGFVTTLLLGQCDDLVVSELSTYGVNGAAIGGKKPVVCHYDRMCWRHETPEPCHYTPFPVKTACKEDQIRPYFNNYPGTLRTCAFFYWRSVFKGRYTWPDYYGALNYSTDGSALGK